MRITVTTGIALLTLVLAALPSAMAAESGSSKLPLNAVGSSSLETQPPKSSRLRFRSGGPVCMCVNGLSEAEISAAERERLEVDDTASQEIID